MAPKRQPKHETFPRQATTPTGDHAVTLHGPSLSPPSLGSTTKKRASPSSDTFSPQSTRNKRVALTTTRSSSMKMDHMTKKNGAFSISDIDSLIREDDDTYASVFNAVGENMDIKEEKPKAKPRNKTTAVKKRDLHQAPVEMTLPSAPVDDGCREVEGYLFPSPPSALLKTVMLRREFTSEPLDPMPLPNIKPANLFTKNMSGDHYFASNELLSAIEVEIYKSLRVEPIALQKPACKDEVRLRYRVKDCFWHPLVGTRHMKTFSTIKYGFGAAWALARAVAYYMARYSLLPPSFALPMLPKWSTDVTEEMEHYIRLRLSGTYGDMSAPRKIPPKVPRRLGIGRGRKRIANCADRLIIESYASEVLEYSKHMEKEKKRVEELLESDSTRQHDEVAR